MKTFFGLVNKASKVKTKGNVLKGIKVGDQTIFDDQQIENITRDYFTHLYLKNKGGV